VISGVSLKQFALLGGASGLPLAFVSVRWVAWRRSSGRSFPDGHMITGKNACLTPVALPGSKGELQYRLECRGGKPNRRASRVECQGTVDLERAG